MSYRKMRKIDYVTFYLKHSRKDLIILIKNLYQL